MWDEDVDEGTYYILYSFSTAGDLGGFPPYQKQKIRQILDGSLSGKLN